MHENRQRSVFSADACSASASAGASLSRQAVAAPGHGRSTSAMNAHLASAAGPLPCNKLMMKLSNFVRFCEDDACN